MNVYEVTSKSIKKCSDCRKDIDKFDNFYMFVVAQNKNKNNGIDFYLCKHRKDKIKIMELTFIYTNNVKTK